ncbi:MAG: AAA family ATPase [Nitrospirae bacterium]|nr:AAA family ATPase [Nitrospirota bacterium]MBF0535333.1 AAA family ATPase [Nitrospirota bacterium]MBF0617244.1 AAA family ATPase [Nitrospirota bacterium]
MADDEKDFEILKKVVLDQSLPDKYAADIKKYIKTLSDFKSNETLIADLKSDNPTTEALEVKKTLSPVLKSFVKVVEAFKTNEEIFAILKEHNEFAESFNLFEELNESLREILSPDLSASSRKLYIFDSITSHFSEVNITEFRCLKNIELKNLSTINIFAGINNSGKTSVLEAIKLLSSLNNKLEFIDLIRLRAKSFGIKATKTEWFTEQIPTAHISGIFSDVPVSLSLTKEDCTVDDETYYVTSALFDIKACDQFSSKIHFFKNDSQMIGETKSLRPSLFSSPFTDDLNPKLLMDCHRESLKAGSKKMVIDFIKKHIDNAIQNIELNDIDRFTVVHDTMVPNPDLTVFGEGLQRIFKMGMLFAAAKNGVVLIDEFENAIHASLLPKVVLLVYKLAVEFNVQIFLTSHSKECIDAFAMCEDLPKDDLSAYSLVKKDNEITCVYFSGQRLARLIDVMDLDLRGSVSE